jgi:hypothetical protein
LRYLDSGIHSYPEGKFVSQPSPYTPGEVAHSIVGRAAQLSYFDERIQVITQLRRFVARVRVDHASRGLGKTTLLRQAERRMRAAGMRTVWVTADPEESLVASVLGKLASTVPPGSSRWDALKASVDSASLSLGIPSIVEASVTMSPQRTAPTAGAAESFKQAIVAATDAIEADGGTGLAVLVDEIQAADASGLRAIAYAWQELASERPSTPAGLFAVGLPNTSEVIGRAVTFSERFDYRPLLGLADEEVELALAGPASSAGVRWTTDALQLAVRESEGYPHKVQLLGDEAWKAAGYPPAGSVITESMVTAALSGVDEQMAELFRARWRSASPAEREMLLAIARLGGTRVKREEIADALGKSTRSISSARDRLMQKGIVEASEFGFLSFTAPGFREYILRIEEN